MYWTNLQKIFILVILILSSVSSVHAQSKSNKGKEFWLAFMSHIEGTDAGMSLYITSDSNTTGTVSIPGQNWSTTFSVTANNLTIVAIPVTSAYISCSDCKSAKGVKVVSQKDIVVYSHHYEGDKSDATLVLPTETQGKNYYLASWQQNSPNFGGGSGRNVFAIVAAKDNTKVKIYPTADLVNSSGGTINAGSPYHITLDEGEVYHAKGKSSTGDLTGSRVEVIDTGATANCRTVAVFCGSTYTRLGSCGNFGQSGDNLYEQMYPTSSLGKLFVLVPAKGRSGDAFRFIGTENVTQIIVLKPSGAPDQYNIGAGGYSEISNESDVRFVVSNKPIMVAQYQRTARCDGGSNRIGDPSMIMLNPLEQTLKDITVYSSSFHDIDNHYINVVIPSYATSTFRIDGNSVSFTSVPGYSSYSYARITVTSGNHRLTADVGFIATAYGEGEYESYGYSAGAKVKDLTAVAKLANSKKTTELSNCVGQPTNFAGDAEYAVLKWFWKFGDGTVDSVQNPTHYYSDTGDYQVTMYTYKTTYDGCSNFDSSLLNIHIYGTPSARISNINLCDSSNAKFIDISIMPPGELKNRTVWKVNDEPLRSGTTLNRYLDTVGKFNLWMETSTRNFCTDTFIDSLLVHPSPNASFDEKLNFCFNDSSYVVSKSIIDFGKIENYIWECPTATSTLLTDSMTSFFVQDSGYHLIALTVVSDSGCSDIFIDSVYKYPQIQSSFTFVDTCFGISNSFSNSSTIDAGTFSDTTWYISDFDTAHSFHYNTTFSSSGDYTVTLVMEQDSLCTDTFSRIVTVDPLPVPNFGISGQCIGDTSYFTDLTTHSTSYTRVWNLDDGGVSRTDSLPRVFYSLGGYKNIQLTTTSTDGCVKDTIIATLISSPEIVQLNLSDDCMDAINEVSSTNTLGLDSIVDYTWTISGSQVSTDSLFNHTYGTSGMNIIELNIRTKYNCVRSMVDSFEVFTAPVADFTVNNVCSNKPIAPKNQSTVTVPQTITNYSWYMNNVLQSNNATPSFSSGDIGTLPIKLVVLSNNGCTDSIENNIVLHPKPVSQYMSSKTCLGQETNFTNLSSGILQTTDWTIDGTKYSSSDVSHTFGTPGNYNVKLIVISDSNCLDSSNSTVTVHPLPVLDVSLNSYEGCIPFEVTTTNNSSISSGNIDMFEWEWGDKNTATGSTPTHTYNSVGTFTIRVKATSNEGCMDSALLSDMVTVLDVPIADFTFVPLEPSTLTEFVTFNDNSSVDVIDWSWTTSDGGFYTDSVAYHNFGDSGTYIVNLEVLNANGCSATVSKPIYVNADLFVHIPTGFSPNGDGINDTYGLGGLTQGVVDMNMMIFNRWGEKIFESTNANDRWDGTYKGKPVQQGVYVYMVQFTNPKKSKWHYFNGEIHLLR